MFLETRVYQGSSGKVYPMPFTDRIATQPCERQWQAVHIENEFLRVMVCLKSADAFTRGLTRPTGTTFSTVSTSSSRRWWGLAGHGSRAAWSLTGRSTTGPRRLCP